MFSYHPYPVRCLRLGNSDPKELFYGGEGGSYDVHK